MQQQTDFQKILMILNDMVDNKDITAEDLVVVCKYGARNANPHDSEKATPAELDIWDRVMFLLERELINRYGELKNEERQRCEIWTRVMGYFRPESEFNQGKKAEFTERKYFSEEKAV